MLFIFNVFLPENKSVRKALSLIYGIGDHRALLICNKVGLGKRYTIKQLNEFQIYQIGKFIDKNFLIKEELKKRISKNIAKLIYLKTYKGYRHKITKK